MRQPGRPFAFLVLAVATLGLATPARADDRNDRKQACATAAEDAQQLRMDAKLRAARDRLLVCSRPECPATVLRDCSQWMNEVAALMPTVVLGARDSQGRDVLSAQVSVDGVAVASGLDGKAIEVDPGTHTFRFVSGAATAEQAVLIREGEKGRSISVTLDVQGATPAAAPTPPPPPAAESTQSRPAVSPWTWVLAGVGIVGIGVGTYLELSVNADASSLQNSCGHGCSHSAVDPLVLKQQVLGPIAFGVGALGLGLATYTFFAVPTANGGATAGVAGRF
jgi:hypothetical protein